MQNLASERLKRLSGQIIHSWEARALKEVEASVHETSLVLINSLPAFLEKVVEAHSTTIDRTETKVKWDRADNKRINRPFSCREACRSLRSGQNEPRKELQRSQAVLTFSTRDP